MEIEPEINPIVVDDEEEDDEDAYADSDEEEEAENDTADSLIGKDDDEWDVPKGPSTNELISECTEACITDNILTCEHYIPSLPADERKSTLFQIKTLCGMTPGEQGLSEAFRRRLFKDLLSVLNNDADDPYHLLHASRLFGEHLTTLEQHAVIDKIVAGEEGLESFVHEYSGIDVWPYKYVFAKHLPSDEESRENIFEIVADRACRWRINDLFELCMDPHGIEKDTHKLLMFILLYRHGWVEGYERHKEYIGDKSVLSKFKTLLRNLVTCECQGPMNEIIFSILGKRLRLTSCDKCATA